MSDFEEALRSMSAELSNAIAKCDRAAAGTEDEYARAYYEGEANAYRLIRRGVEIRLRMESASRAC